MWNCKKIKAFTIIELITVMIISSIVITITLTMYNNISKVYSNAVGKNEFENEIALLYLIIKRDLTDAEMVFSMEDQIQMNVEGNNRISYMFNQDNIIRYTRGMNDTLYRGNYEYEVGETDDKIVESLTIILKNEQISYPLKLYKVYSASTFFKKREQIR